MNRLSKKGRRVQPTTTQKRDSPAYLPARGATPCFGIQAVVFSRKPGADHTGKALLWQLA